MNIQRIGASLLSLLFPRDCALCGNPSPDGELCADCRRKYAEGTFLRCPNCSMTADRCLCGMDLSARTTLAGRPYLALNFYIPADRLGKEYENRVTERMILDLKRRGTFADFFAGECARQLGLLFREAGERPQDWVLTVAPRSPEKFAEVGFDQSEEVGRRTAKRLGCPFCQTLARSSASEQQKALGAEERQENAREGLLPRKRAIREGGRYLLFDDIITTGATVRRAAELLYEAGAADVFPVALARTYPIPEPHPKR
ncbi:MAG: double zinc ribbon domain-containing protein [Clostridiales bacterium]|nr:double zinc ribbon domain-containing protein [Clostridiales bacterium]